MLNLFFFLALRPNAGHGLFTFEVARPYTDGSQGQTERAVALQEEEE
jgi:hypothetical protein